MVIAVAAAAAVGASSVRQPVPPLPDGDPDAVRRRADDILSGPDYRDDETIIERALRWVDELLADILSRLTTGGTGTIVAWLLLAVAVLGVAWALRDVRPGPWRRSRADGPAPVVRRRDEPDLDAAGWLAEADRCAAADDRDGEVRARYRATIAGLVEDGLLGDTPGRTSGEVLIAMAHTAADLLEPLTGLTHRFEEIWYSPRRATAADVALVTDLAAAVTAAQRSSVRDRELVPAASGGPSPEADGPGGSASGPAGPGFGP